MTIVTKTRVPEAGGEFHYGTELKRNNSQEKRGLRMFYFINLFRSDQLSGKTGSAKLHKTGTNILHPLFVPVKSLISSHSKSETFQQNKKM